MGLTGEWEHSICEPCWRKVVPDREPAQSDNRPPESCCWCGEIHRSGIRKRHSPGELLCNGDHT